MPKHVAHSRWWQIFEVVVGMPFVAAIVLQQVVPLSLPRALQTVARVTGVPLILVGAGFVVLARRELRRRGQPTDPGRPTRTLVTTGVFAISRNPLYFGGLCLLAGLALAVDLPWVLLLLPPSFGACLYVLVAPEEQYLAALFGEQYRRYTESVHRWIGNARGAG